MVLIFVLIAFIILTMCIVVFVWYQSSKDAGDLPIALGVTIVAAMLTTLAAEAIDNRLEYYGYMVPVQATEEPTQEGEIDAKES